MIGYVKKESDLTALKSEVEFLKSAAKNAENVIFHKEAHIDSLIQRLYELEQLLVTANGEKHLLESALDDALEQIKTFCLQIRENRTRYGNISQEKIDIELNSQHLQHDQVTEESYDRQQYRKIENLNRLLRNQKEEFNSFSLESAENLTKTEESLKAIQQSRIWKSTELLRKSKDKLFPPKPR